eukprot:8740011-Pyramimonas_sp.AAC.1
MFGLPLRGSRGRKGVRRAPRGRARGQKRHCGSDGMVRCEANQVKTFWVCQVGFPRYQHYIETYACWQPTPQRGGAAEARCPGRSGNCP